MCLVLFAKNVWDSFPYLILANRDEFFDRPTKAAAYWEDQEDVFAGRDLSSFGTWLGVSKKGRLAFLTNRRNLREPNPSSPLSRGKLVSGFLLAKSSPREYIEEIQNDKDKYPGFNLFVSDLKTDLYVSNRLPESQTISDGIHSLSNAEWNTEWPKTSRIRSGFASILDSESRKESLPIPSFFSLLDDQVRADQKLLPDTGIGVEKEILLSSIRIRVPGYGTRVSTVVAIDQKGICHFWERTFRTPDDAVGSTIHESFRIG